MPSDKVAKERNRYRLSDAAVTKLPPHDPASRSSEKEWADSECVGLRMSVGKGGRKHWDIRYRVRQQKQVLRLGEWPSVNTAEARKRANEIKAKASAGIDPKTERASARAMPTVAEYAETDYVPHARRTIRSAHDSEQRLRVHVLPTLGKKRLDGVRRGDIEKLHGMWLDHMAAASANRILATIKALFSHAVRNEVIERSPAQGVRSHKENNARQRSLSGEELSAYIRELEQEPNLHLRGLLKFLLSTGMRRGEAIAAKWEHVDQQNHTLLVPHTKAGKARNILLNDAALAVLAEVPREKSNPHLFHGHKAGQPINEPKFAHARACKRAGITNFKIHDLRHTFASLAVSNGASLYTVQALLGHASPTMTQRYSHLAIGVVRQGTNSVSDALRAATPEAPKSPQAEPIPTEPPPATTAENKDTPKETTTSSAAA